MLYGEHRGGERLRALIASESQSLTPYSESDLRFLIELAHKHGCYLLVDETYRDRSFGPALPLAASLSPHVISVSSLSKAYGVPGLRLGWLITRDSRLQELFLAAKEQMSICGSVIDEWVAEQILAERTRLLAPMLSEMRRRRQLVTDWMAGEELLEWVPPDGGVVCFPRIRPPPTGAELEAGLQAISAALEQRA